MIWVVFNQKGGVGKTSISCNLAASFAKKGYRTLVIDLDSQGNSSQYIMGEKYQECREFISDYFISTLKVKIFQKGLENYIQNSPYDNLDVIPANQELAEIQSKLENRYKILKLKQAINELVQAQPYDHILIDTPPSLDFFSMSALIASEKLIIPYDCDAFSMNAILNVLDTAQEIKDDYQTNLNVEGVVVNNFQKKTKLSDKAIEDLEARGIKLIRPFISSSIIMKESHLKQIPLPFYKPTHKICTEFNGICASLLEDQTNTLNPAYIKSNGKARTEKNQFL